MNFRTNDIKQQQPAANPTKNSIWLRPVGLVGNAGQAMGTLGLTYAQPVAASYVLSIRTNENTTVGTNLGTYGG